MNLAAAILAVVLFAVAFRLLDLRGISSQGVTTTRRALETITAPGLTDSAREAEVRKASGRLFLILFRILGLGLVALALPALFVAALDGTGLVEGSAVGDHLMSWQVILTGIVLVGGIELWRT